MRISGLAKAGMWGGAVPLLAELAGFLKGGVVL
jgi:hypothetical protein